MTSPIALPVKRLPKQTLHHVWAPKLNRTVVLAGRDQLHLWVMLEAHPAVSRYCERPTWPDENETSPNPDFWALRDGSAVWLALGDVPQIDPNAAPLLPPSIPTVEWISAEALDQHRVWVQNWLSLLPYLGAYDKGEFPASSGWNYARFFVPRAYAGGLRMAESAPKLWRAFEDAHLQAQLDGPPEIPMKYFTAAIEAALLTCVERDSETLSLDAAFWTAMVDRSRYVMARRAGRTMLSAITVR